MAANRERRANAGKRDFATAQIEELKAVREGKLSRANQIKLAEQKDIYDEMDDHTYAAFVKARTENDQSFVEDDGLGDGYMDDGEEDWDGSEEGQRKRAISKVAMPLRRAGQKGPVMGVDNHVASVFLGAGRAVRPGQYSGPGGGGLNEDDDDNLKHFLSELKDDEDDGEESARHKRQRMMKVTMFGQSGELQSELNKQYEDQIINEDGTITKRERTGLSASDLSAALFGGSSAIGGSAAAGKGRASKRGAKSSEFAKPLPRITMDDDGNIADDTPVTGAGWGEESDEYAAASGFGIGDSLKPDLSDPTFIAAKAAAAKRIGAAGRLPPTASKEVGFANAEGGIDWLKLSSSGVPSVKIERGNVIASRPSEAMEHHSPVYQVKVEVAAAPDAATDGEPQVRSETYDELTMFWYDACEQDGSVYLFGKALLPDKKSTTSCCVRVCNMERNLFVLPRAFKVTDEEDELHTVTDEPVKLLDIHSEVKAILHDIGVTKFKSKMVKRDYCFDRDLPDFEEMAKLPEDQRKSSLLDTDEGVPASTQYLKVLYSFSSGALPRNMKGKTFSRIFGTKSTALELFLLKRRLMGPCWITIKNVEACSAHAASATGDKNSAAFSWCKFSFQTSNQKNVRVLEDCPDAPLFSVLSLSLKTVLNETNNRHEIVMASYMFHEGVSVEGPTANETDFQHCTIVSKLPQSVLGKKGGESVLDALIACPPDFEVRAKAQNAADASKAAAAAAAAAGKKGVAPPPRHTNKLEVVPTERALLSLLLTRIHVLDPDCIVSHDLHGFGIDVLLSRMSKNAVGLNWSKLGRLQKSKMPQVSGRPGDGDFSLVDRGAGSGRLMVDTMVCAKEFLTAQKMYTLSYLAETQLQVKHEEIEASSIPLSYKTTPTLLELIKANENDAFLQLRLMFKLVMLPLSKQLTCLCGNMWARSLRAARAERVEFLLLHDFHGSKFLIPEKYTNKERKEKEQQREEEEKRKLGNDPTKLKALRASKNKPQYAGGLVLEPKRGFYDKYVLLLDFNSLYPSIIQEFNVCFTTVHHWSVKQGEMAAVPPAGSVNGHLPKVIKRLVQRRRNVKDMLKKEANPAKRTELDIRQKALKLVANSMYGCLGFVSSRFYCEPLAALITSQGREILQSSVELTNSLGANVIYGDTDSIMVYSNETDLGKCMDLGKKIKLEINKRHKILEIDIDGVFKNMLLLRKKKYAALKIVEQPDGKFVSQREVKGLDLVRRDWCPLSKEIGFKVLNEILSGAPREEVVEKIHAHLMALRDAIKLNQIPMEKFIITKGLTKNPKEYTDAKNMPHVKVALDLLAKGKSCKSGDFIGYVICKNAGGNDAQLAARAYDPAHVMSMGGGLELDLKWYLTNQILPPVARLIGPIEETDAGKVAYALGLDPKAFHNFGSKDEKAVGDGDDDDPLLLQGGSADDEEKFKQAVAIQVSCPHCEAIYQFPGVFHKLDGSSNVAIKPADAAAIKEEMKEGDTEMAATAAASSSAMTDVKKESVQGIGSGSLQPLLSGLKCPNFLTTGCPGLLSTADDAPRVLTQLSNRINCEIRRQTQKYYSGFYKCNDSSCGRRSRDLSVKGNQCQAQGCKGRMEREFPASQLYLQLQYFRSLFDVERAIEGVQAENQRRKSDPRNSLPQLQAVVPGLHADVYKKMHGYMVSVLRQSSYYWLSPTIFDTKVASKR